ncbi:RDD family protein [Pelomonas sp. KK5]|uniref:RDD family protein n=1 Tax=Pelomonas sp. KK5 TaxID=1855730 RepID=UPI00097CA3F9|nr:RDD family protein [Pelomonas sp. KK5]
MAAADEFEYVGFWPRVGASLIDTILASVVLWPLLGWLAPKDVTVVQGPDWSIESLSVMPSRPGEFLITHVLPAIIVIIFWIKSGSTPGKMAIGARVVDARSGAALTTGQAIVRYLGYYVSIIPFCLGLLWVAFDGRKQGWHDKIAGTVVIRSKKKRGTEPVSFDNRPA